MLSKLLSFPFAIAAIYFFYMTMKVEESYAIYIVPDVIAIAVLYILSPQIDWFWV